MLALEPRLLRTTPSYKRVNLTVSNNHTNLDKKSRSWPINLCWYCFYQHNLPLRTCSISAHQVRTFLTKNCAKIQNDFNYKNACKTEFELKICFGMSARQPYDKSYFCLVTQACIQTNPGMHTDIFIYRHKLIPYSIITKRQAGSIICL